MNNLQSQIVTCLTKQRKYLDERLNISKDMAEIEKLTYLAKQIDDTLEAIFTNDKLI